MTCLSRMLVSGAQWYDHITPATLASCSQAGEL